MPVAFNYKQAVNKLLAIEVVDQAQKLALKDGTIDPKVKLFLDLGLTVNDIKAMAQDFNEMIVNFGKKPPKRVTTAKLAKCDTLESIYKLVGEAF